MNYIAVLIVFLGLFGAREAFGASKAPPTPACKSIVVGHYLGEPLIIHADLVEVSRLGIQAVVSLFEVKISRTESQLIEHIVFFQGIVEASANKVQDALVEAEIRYGAPAKATAFCHFGRPGFLDLYPGFYQLDPNGQYAVLGITKSFDRPLGWSDEINVPNAHGGKPPKTKRETAKRERGHARSRVARDGLSPADGATPTPSSALTGVQPEKLSTSRLYPWMSEERVRTITDGLPAIAALKTQCSSDDRFMVFALGTVSKNDQRSKVEINIRELLGVTQHIARDQESIESDKLLSNLNSSDYWCPEKKNFCYKLLKNGAFGLKRSRGDKLTLEEKEVYSLNDGALSAFAYAFEDNCKFGVTR
ncbi:MAG: hypothetical protein AAGF81_00700 [Pseudomonadota bacterium]